MANRNKQKNNNASQTYLSISNTNPINKLHFKVPEFPINNKKLINQWFETCINLFKFNNITDDRTICTHLINHFPHELLSKIKDKLLDFSKSTKPLTELRDTINKYYPQNQDEILDDCYNESNLGDRRPSDYMNELSQKLKDENGLPNNNLIKYFFYRILPTNVKNILLANKNLSLEDQGLLADQIYINEDNNMVSSINKQHNKIEKDNHTIEFLLNKIEKMNQEIKVLKGELETKRTNFTSHNNPRTNPIAKDTNTFNPYCYYHSKFGKKAFNCTPSCKYTEQNLNSNNHLDTHQN